MGVRSEQSSLPAQYRRLVVLRDGGQILLRPVCRADKDAVRDMVGRLSPDTRFLRFHHYKPGLTEREIDYFCDVDQENHIALVAEMTRRGRDEIVGAGRFYRLARGDRAEVSFVVEDAEQGRGIGTVLLRSLAELARDKGVTTLVAELLYENTVMMHVFRSYDPGLRVVVNGHCYHVTFSARGPGTA